MIYGQRRRAPLPVPGARRLRPSASLNTIKKKWYCYTCHAHGDLTGETPLVEPDYEVMKQWIDEKLMRDKVYAESWLSRWDAGLVTPTGWREWESWLRVSSDLDMTLRWRGHVPST